MSAVKKAKQSLFGNKSRHAQKKIRKKKTKKLPASADFLKKCDASVKTPLGQSIGIPTFLSSVGALSRSQKELLVDQALVLFQQCYVHLPLKEAMHAVDPIQSLTLLRSRLDSDGK